MIKTFLTCSIMAFVLVGMVACDTPRDELGKLVDTQTQATIAAAQYQSVRAEATTRAEATLQFLAIQGQQTRIAQQAIDAQTKSAQDAHATQTLFAQRAAATQVAYNQQATSTRIAQDATATAYSAQVTAARQQAIETQTMIAIQATQTANMQSVIDNQTRVAASATVTAIAADAQNTRAAATATTQSISATIAVANANVAVEQSKAEWNQRMESVRAIGSTIGIVAFLVGFCAVVGFVVLKFAAALEMRTRTIYDANGVPYVVLPPGKDGRQHTLIPSRANGAVVEITPPLLDASNIQSAGSDPDTVKRDQAVQLVLAASNNQGRVVEELIDDAAESEVEPPADVTISNPFESRTLDLSKQPSKLALPIGVTNAREMWVSLGEISHVLTGGPSGLGKTNLLHGWVQSLIASEQVDLAIYDGKSGMEFGRYATAPRTDIVPDDLAPYLGDMVAEMQRRFDLLRAAGVNNLADYNRHRDTDDKLDHWVIVIDELYGALQMTGVEEALLTLANKGRAEGMHLVMATQLPDAQSIPRHLRFNALLRIAFACPTPQNSQAILGVSGAEKISKVPGRLLVFWQGQTIQAQAFRAALPPMPRTREIGGGSNLNLPPPSAFDDETRQVIDYAVKYGAGWFVVSKIAAALGIRDARVSKIARALERQGFLSEVKKDESGQNVGRQISPKLSGLLTA